MTKQITVSSQKLAEYIREHADVIAQQADIEIETENASEWGGRRFFIPFITVDIRLRKFSPEELEEEE